MQNALEGSAQRMQVVVDDIETPRVELCDAGLDIGEIEDAPSGRFAHFSGPRGTSPSGAGLPMPYSASPD